MAGRPSVFHDFVQAGSAAADALVAAQHSSSGTAYRYFWMSENGTTWVQGDTGTKYLGGGAGGPDGFYFARNSAGTDTLSKATLSGGVITINDISSHATINRMTGKSAIFGNTLYSWLAAVDASSGGAAGLFAYEDITQSGAATVLKHRPVNVNIPTTKYRQCVTIDKGVAYSISWMGGTHVYKYITAGEEVWFEPGMDNALMTYHRGNLFLLGNTGGVIKLVGLNLDQGVPVPMADVRIETLGGSPLALAPGPGDSLLLGVNLTGNAYDIYQYDITQDSLTQVIRFDSTTSGLGQMKGLIGFGGYRYALLNNSSDQLVVMKLDRDSDTPSTTTWDLTDAAWDFDLPQEEKILTNLHVLHPPGTGSSSFLIEYQLNESGTWVSTGTQTPASGATSTTITLSPAGGTIVKFREIRLRYTGPHQFYRVTVETEVKRSREMWELLIDLHDEPRNIGGNQRWGEQKRDSLITLARTGEPVAFKDGRRYRHQEGGTADDTVVVEVVRDSIPTLGEGVMRVRLRRTR